MAFLEGLTDRNAKNDPFARGRSSGLSEFRGTSEHSGPSPGRARGMTAASAFAAGVGTGLLVAALSIKLLDVEWLVVSIGVVLWEASGRSRGSARCGRDADADPAETLGAR